MKRKRGVGVKFVLREGKICSVVVFCVVFLESDGVPQLNLLFLLLFFCCVVSSQPCESDATQQNLRVQEILLMHLTEID